MCCLTDRASISQRLSLQFERIVLSEMLTKSDFLRYLQCPQSAWLSVNKPDDFPEPDLNLFERKIIAEGFEVEAYAQKLFPNGVHAPAGPDAAAATQALLDRGEKVIFQATFTTPDGLHVRVDILERSDDGALVLHEVKSSSEVKTDPVNNHIKDVCFQYITLRRAGIKLDRVCLVHLNRSYIKQGQIDPAQLLTLTEITPQVLAMVEATETEIAAALTYLKQTSIDESHCACLNNTRGHRCASFEYFNMDLPPHSIYELARLKPSKLQKLQDMNIRVISDIPEDFELTGYQDMQRHSLIEGLPVMDLDAIEEELDALSWPLYFIDFETFSSAIPKIDRTKPHQAIPFQYSLHVLHRDGTLEEYGFIADKLELPILLIAKLREQIGQIGSLISWHAAFEKQRNSEMAIMFPEQEPFLTDLNRRTYDLERIFRTSYVDARFRGSSSIKNVLPVLLPQFSYAALAIQDGTSAMEAWYRMTTLEPASRERDEIRRALIEYCTLDTLAMVEIYRYLRGVTDENNAVAERPNPQG